MKLFYCIILFSIPCIASQAAKPQAAQMQRHASSNAAAVELGNAASKVDVKQRDEKKAAEDKKDKGGLLTPAQKQAHVRALSMRSATLSLRHKALLNQHKKEIMAHPSKLAIHNNALTAHNQQLSEALKTLQLHNAQLAARCKASEEAPDLKSAHEQIIALTQALKEKNEDHETMEQTIQTTATLYHRTNTRYLTLKQSLNDWYCCFCICGDLPSDDELDAANRPESSVSE